MTKKTTIACIVGLILVAIVMAGVVLMPPKAPEFRTDVVKQGTVSASVEVSGRVAYPDSRRLSFMTGGLVSTVNVQVGSAVNRGAILATLESVTTYSPTGEAVVMTPAITTPIDGVVTSLMLAVGELVLPGQVVAVVEGPRDTFQVVMSVPENDIAALDVGDDVAIALDAIEGVPFTGVIRDIAPTSMNESGVVFYEVTATLESASDEGKGAYGDIRSGMSAAIEIVIARDYDALYVPQRAVITRDGQSFVRVPADNENGYEERSVATGLRGDNNVIVITEGLAEGDTVITKIEE